MDLSEDLKKRFDSMPLEDVTLNAGLLNTVNDDVSEIWAYVFERKHKGQEDPISVSSLDEE